MYTKDSQRPATKGRPSTFHLGKGNLPGVMAGQGSWMRCRRVISEQRESSIEVREGNLHKDAPPGLFTPILVRVRSPSRVRYQLMDTQQGFCTQQRAPSLVSDTPCHHLVPVSCRTTQILNPTYLLLRQTGILPLHLYSSPSTGRKSLS